MTSDSSRYVVAGSKKWNRRVFEEVIRHYPGEWSYAGDPATLDVAVEEIEPRYVFFLHWSWIVPRRILDRTECVCFHMTDVPYGRGGSPLQNLIVRGHTETRLTALRMTDELDAGPVYGKRPLSLHGSAEEIYVRATDIAAEMVREIVDSRPEPVPQSGEVVPFARRKPAASEVAGVASLEALHDFIRMLDADGYPPAFLEHAGFRFELTRSVLYDGRIVADVTITPAKRTGP
jgi:methionyl-tRNA formyltransferase